MLMGILGWWIVASYRIFRATYDDCAIHHRNRNGNRDVDCADVPERAVRGKQAWSACCIRATLRRSWDCDRILVRLRHELHSWLDRMASTDRMPGSVRYRTNQLYNRFRYHSLTTSVARHHHGLRPSGITALPL